ncbi:MAG: glycoside hydrolase family 15 protein [Nitriliruptoraceae bacterium]
MSTALEDYAVIGDTETVALVSRWGAIDWLCLPRFDSPACFASLLGDGSHGEWQLAPAGTPRAISRRYRPGTLVLETVLGDEHGGTVRVIDVMPPRGLERGHNPDVVRVVEGVTGRVTMRMRLTMRFDYGAVVPWVSRTGPHTVQAIAGPDALLLTTPVPLHGEDMTTVAEFEVGPGDRVPFVLTWYPSHEAPPAPIDAEMAIEDSTGWWQGWSQQSTYRGQWPEPVERSLITLKALTYAPTGGIVAAPTTSLPEHLGGTRNWDYRFVWLRDATFTLQALMLAGYRQEALAWRDWLLRAVAGDPAKLQIMYGIAGERRLTETELPWLPGYEHSAPVRIGNGAYDQFQLDVYGEVMDAMHYARATGMPPSSDAWSLQRAFTSHLEEHWDTLDHGIWEMRGPKHAFTHSRVMAWVALDRAVRTVEQSGLDGPVDRWRRLRDTIHAEVLDRGFDAGRSTFTQYYGSSALDASLLLIPQVGFLPPEDPRVHGTVAAIERELGLGDGLVLRYPTTDSPDGLPPGEGAFLLCSFWLVDALAMLGRGDDARRIFEHLLTLRNDVGLLAEEYEPAAGRLLGNFPQAFSHLGLVASVYNLGKSRGPADERGGNP